VTPPTLLIRIELEDRAPTVRTACATEEQRLRLVDWLEHQPRLLSLVAAALELERTERAA
jgi:hypothetical protein